MKKQAISVKEVFRSIIKVAMLHWAFPPVIGGVESHLAMLGPELVRSGLEVSLLTSSAEGLPELDNYMGVTVKRTSLMDLNLLPPDRLKKSASLIRLEIMSYIEEQKPGLIHAHNLHYFSTAHIEALADIRENKGLPLLLTAHNVWHDGLSAEINDMSHIWDGIIAVSNFVKQDLVKSGYPEKKIFTVHHGIDLRRFPYAESIDRSVEEKHPALKGRRIIFHPARMCYDKGTHVSIQALDLIRKEFPDALLVLAETRNMVDWFNLREEYCARIQDMISTLGLEDYIYTRWFPWHEISAMYRRAEVCIYPSCFQEPFGLAMLESLACGRPIVVSRAGGMPEVVQEGINGFLVDMHDYEDLAEKCCCLLANPSLAARMGYAGRKMVEEKFNIGTMVANTLGVYRILLKLPRHGKSRPAGEQTLAPPRKQAEF
jgi:glycosyltransferase involved in cell wall biosynthesis